MPSRLRIRNWCRKRRLAEDVVAATANALKSPVLDALLNVPAMMAAKQNSQQKRGAAIEKFRPNKLIKALKFGHHLRTGGAFTEALDDGLSYLKDDTTSDEAPGERRSRKLDPARRTLERSKLRLDALAMLLERREVASWMVDPNFIRSIHVFTDASPVTGTEIQGMILEIFFRTGEMQRRILPGISMQYGFNSVLDKVIALIWALWLVAGPLISTVAFLKDKIRSITTDYGHELDMHDVADVTDAFFLWLRGTSMEALHGTVDAGTRFFQTTLRIGGWSHTLGNIMKQCIQTYSRYITNDYQQKYP